MERESTVNNFSTLQGLIVIRLCACNIYKVFVKSSKNMSSPVFGGERGQILSTWYGGKVGPGEQGHWSIEKTPASITMSTTRADSSSSAWDMSDHGHNAKKRRLDESEAKVIAYETAAKQWSVTAMAYESTDRCMEKVFHLKGQVSRQQYNFFGENV